MQAHGPWSWGGTPPLTFAPGGELRTPWGAGRWGPTEADDILYADFVGMKHQLTFDAGFAKFTSARCGDGEPVLGKLDRK